MKRSTPLCTYTPLRRGKPLRSTKPIPKLGAKALRESEALTAFRAVVHARQFCELQTPACPPGRHAGHHAHHVWPSDRRIGIHNPQRGLLACWAGHAWVHDHPEISYERGWLGRAS